MKIINKEILIIGSGFGAAAPALRLSKAGFEVLMIEKGKNIIPEMDFRQTSDPKYYLQYYRGISNETVGMTYVEAFGGASGFYEMVSLRAPSRVFDQIDKSGNRLWPGCISRNTLDPYYDIAEKMLNVEQLEMSQIPKTGVAFSRLMKNLGYSCERSRYAVKGCHGSGFCYSGCIFGAKQSLHLNYLPQAKYAGLEIMTDTEAESVSLHENMPDEMKFEKSIHKIPYRFRVVCVDNKNKEEFEVHTRILILSGGTIGTAKLLLSSQDTLPLLSKHIGKNIALNGSVKSAGLLPDGFIEGDMLTGRSHPGMISYHFFDSRGITIAAAKLLPLQLTTGARFYSEGDSGKSTFWGESNVSLMKQYKRKMIILYALGLTLPGTELSQNGGNTFEINLKPDQELIDYMYQTRGLLDSIFHRNGCKVLDFHLIDHEGRELDKIHFDTSHMVGSCRMSDSSENGVVNSSGEMFQYPGIYITDGSSIPSSLAVNTSLTILANAERIADILVNRYTVKD